MSVVEWQRDIEPAKQANNYPQGEKSLRGGEAEGQGFAVERSETFEPA